MSEQSIKSPRSQGRRFIMLAAGGTGGHMAPADALAVHLQDKDMACALITDPRGASYANMLQGVERFILPVPSHQRGGIMGKFLAAVGLVRGFFKARSYLKAKRPDFIVGFGGYPALPTLLAARSLSIAYGLHDQNAVLGRVNRLLAPSAAWLALGLRETSRIPPKTRVEWTGNPVRKQALRAAGHAYNPPIKKGILKLLIMGGSQGARILSQKIPEALELLPAPCRAQLQIIQQARPEDQDLLVQTYAKMTINAQVAPYFENIPDLIKGVHMAICRAGASSLAELEALHCPALLVPLKIAADDHQSANARAFAAEGAGWILPEEQFSAQAIADLLIAVWQAPDQLLKASQILENRGKGTALDRLADLIDDGIKNKMGDQ